ncbi:uncharacterized protein LOC107363435 isoform X2 [Tetranychus urticae]|nr:uncharacterized protein LOC107363435 isoform X2 [Tetranychus urticae]XP_015786146.1 uncharacterized protein LOC107363435 isoform X2 [Tetranychus urticae]
MELNEGQRKHLEDEVAQEKDRYLRMDVQSKRKFYSCGNKYVDLSSITSWTLYALANHIAGESNGPWQYNETINNKVSLFIGDITNLEIDCIVNAANKKLAGGGGVDGAIHKAAGMESLKKACKLLGGCETGDAKITGGYKLPARYIIHTVGPVGEKPDLLKSCYTKCLDLMKSHNLKSIAFPCISTGVYRYPNEHAAQVACSSVREWLDREPEYVKTIDRVIFCLFMEVDIKAYKNTMATYFPTCDKISNN